MPLPRLAAQIAQIFNPCNPLIRVNPRFRQRGIVGAYRGRDAPPTSSGADSTDFFNPCNLLIRDNLRFRQQHIPTQDTKDERQSKIRRYH